jgi:hypothetical protein
MLSSKVWQPQSIECCHHKDVHFEGEEVFGSQKHKADIPLGS